PAIGSRYLRRGDGDSGDTQYQEFFLFPALWNRGRCQTVVFEDGCCLRRRNAVGKFREVAVAGVGEGFLGGEGDVALGMRTSQVPVPGSVADVQVAPAEDGGRRLDFVLLEGGG